MNSNNLNPDGIELKVSGSRNQCRGCREYFSSNTNFEMHRIGKFEHKNPEGKLVPSSRRCMTREEMVSKGMSQDKEGYWRMPLTEEYWIGR